MQLPLDAAIAVFPHLPTGLRARAAGLAFHDVTQVAHLVQAVCELGADSGVHVGEDGRLRDGDASVSPEESARRFHDRATADPSLVRAADDALKALLSREKRLEAVVRALYAGGLTLSVDVQTGSSE